MHGWFREALANQPVPWHELRGSPEERLQEALGLIRALLENTIAGASPLRKTNAP
jgi:hypothetical protein